MCGVVCIELDGIIQYDSFVGYILLSIDVYH